MNVVKIEYPRSFTYTLPEQEVSLLVCQFSMLKNTKETEIPESKHTVDVHIRYEDEICQIYFQLFQRAQGLSSVKCHRTVSSLKILPL